MNIGFIGCGNMATAMIHGMIGSGVVEAGQIRASAKSEATRRRISEDLHIGVGSNKEVAEQADVLFLAVKPQFYEEVIREIRDRVADETVVVTIAPGKTLAWLTEMFGRPLKLVRTMPNTPAMVGEGMMGACRGELVTDEEAARVQKLCESFGKVEWVSEPLLDVVTAVSGSSPAYVFMFIEAMADAAVMGGMSRKAAYTFAAQAVLGSAKMVLETGMHPGALKDMVCSPGGTTIEAVRVLEREGLRSSVIEAMEACLEKGRKM